MFMKKKAAILLLFQFLTGSCGKNGDIPLSGIATINNVLVFDANRQTYQGYGFSFSRGSLVSILENPGPDITVLANSGNISLQADNLQDSFFMAGEYADEATAIAEFKKLLFPSVPAWTGMAIPLTPGQLWIYRSADEHYAKIRIISVISEVRDSRDYVECTFGWVYQPDGTLTFPG
jgi:hypothetical protein